MKEEKPSIAIDKTDNDDLGQTEFAEESKPTTKTNIRMPSMAQGNKNPVLQLEDKPFEEGSNCEKTEGSSCTSSDDEINNNKLRAIITCTSTTNSDREDTETDDNTTLLQSETGKVQRGGSSPNLLSLQELGARNKGNPNNLLRSVSCLNMALRINNSKIPDTEDSKSSHESHVPRIPCNIIRPRTKKTVLGNDMMPLSRAISARSMNNLPDQVKKSALETRKPGIEFKRPHTAYTTVGKRASRLDRIGVLSPDTDSSSGSDASTNESTKSKASTMMSFSEMSSNSKSVAIKESKTGVSDMNSETQIAATTSNNIVNNPLPASIGATGLLRQQGKNFLAELDSGTLNLYGLGSLNCIDLAWDKNSAQTATSVKFQYISFDEIIGVFPKLRVKFPKLQNFTFEETNLSKCGQLNTLAELHQVSCNLCKFKFSADLLVECNYFAVF